MFVKISDNIRVALDQLRNNKLRSGLTMLGMTIGVAAVILLVSVGQAVEAFIVSEFSSYGSDWVQVMGLVSNTADMSSVGTMESEVVGWFVPFTESEYDALSDPMRVPSAENLAAMVAVPHRVWYAGETGEVQVYGVTPSYMEIFNVHAALGRDIDDQDMQSATQVAVLGVDAVDILFGNTNPLGKEIRIGQVNFEVVGILEDFASVLDQDDNQIILLPITTAWKRMGIEKTVSGEYTITSILAQAVNTDAVDSLMTEMTQVLREERDLEGHDENNFQMLALTDVLDILETVTGMLTLFLGVVAGISLLVGGIGIMNIMLVTVTERTQEIGLRRAVGAQRPDILTQFLTESIVLAFMGGFFGTVLAGMFSVMTTLTVPNLTVHVRPGSILLAALITIAVGAFFGVFPANRAANLNPIDALRHE